MKKRFLIVILAFVCALSCLTGCGLGSFIENGAGKNPSGTLPVDPTNPSDPNDPEDPGNPGTPGKPVDPVVSANDYTVSVYFENKLYRPGKDKVTVVWYSKSDVKRVPLGADGKASAGELNGDYNVYLEGLPDIYTYNPNIYKATEKERKQTILLSSVKKPVGGTGEGLYQSQGCYQVKYDGIYRARVTKANKKVYYEYQPSSAGWYRIESLVNIFANEINPTYDLYGGSIAYKWFTETIDSGGASLPGGFTRNFSAEYKVDKTEVGNAFTFAIGADQIMGQFPVNVDFEIKYLGEYSIESKKVRAKHLPPKAEAANGRAFVWADMSTKIFDVNNFKRNPDTGLYHRYDEVKYASSNGYGPILCCAIKKSIASYSPTTLYDAATQVLGGHGNLWNLYDVWLEDEQKYGNGDFAEFIQTDYNGVCNSDGVCYVTDELITALQKYAEQQMLWSDGVFPQDGCPEVKGYYAKQDSLWLFACGFYE